MSAYIFPAACPDCESIALAVSKVPGGARVTCLCGKAGPTIPGDLDGNHIERERLHRAAKRAWNELPRPTLGGAA